jgi:hypothetical protein
MADLIIRDRKTGSYTQVPYESGADRLYPDHEIIGLAGGGSYVDPGESDESPAPSLKTMTRPELEARATELGIEGADNRETFPNMDTLREAIAAREAEAQDAQ